MHWPHSLYTFYKKKNALLQEITKKLGDFLKLAVHNLNHDNSRQKTFYKSQILLNLAISIMQRVKQKCANGSKFLIQMLFYLSKMISLHLGFNS